ncbi:MAG: DUF3179 domain-containing protein [Calditrichaeota bacterium]|nr:MAG: DUF3179 domain-containing protein [Calditrichota bacterium]
MRRIAAFLLILAAFSLQKLDAQQINYPIPLKEIADNARLGCFGGLDCIPSIQFPTMVPANVATYVQDDDMIMGVNIDGIQKAYPVNSLWFHEIANDNINSKYYAVCYCPLTRTAINVKTEKDGKRFELGVSGLLFNNNLIMYNRTNSVAPNYIFYPQMYFTAISGPEFGKQLELLPVTMSTWKAWKTLFPKTLVVGPQFYEVGSSYPYGDYRTNDRNFIFPQWVDPRRRAKELVFGVTSKNFKAKAYPFADMAPDAVINDVFDGEKVVIFFDEAAQLAIGFDPTSIQGHDILTFQLLSNATLNRFARDRETGSEWNIMGEAVSGPLAGQQLHQLERAYSGFWFAWAAYFKPIEIFSGSTTPVEDDGSPSNLPASFTLEQNYPNPFNPETLIRFYLPQRSKVKLEILSILGETVATLAVGEKAPGWHSVRWNPGNAPAGTYLYRLTAGNFSQIRKMVFLK